MKFKDIPDPADVVNQVTKEQNPKGLPPEIMVILREFDEYVQDSCCSPKGGSIEKTWKAFMSAKAAGFYVSPHDPDRRANENAMQTY